MLSGRHLLEPSWCSAVEHTASMALSQDCITTSWAQKHGFRSAVGYKRCALGLNPIPIHGICGMCAVCGGSNSALQVVVQPERREYTDRALHPSEVHERSSTQLLSALSSCKQPIPRAATTVGTQDVNKLLHTDRCRFSGAGNL
jgi:hypothetical protein